MAYFFTCGRGTETFVAKELNEKFPESEIIQRDGKVFISGLTVHGDGEVTNVESLLLGVRTAERCFVTIFHDTKFANVRSKAVASQLRASVYGVDAARWQKCLTAWRKLQTPASGPHCSVHCSRTDDSIQLTSNSMSVVDHVKDLPTCQYQNPPDDVGSKSAVKRPSADSVMFRVSAKCAGRISSFTSQTLARYIGPLISDASGWITNLRKPDLEVYVHLNNDGLVIGLSACRVPMSVRPYLKHVGLRTTVASIIASLAHIQPGMVVIDPMCGEATILIEAAKQYPGALYIGGDINICQCTAALDNIMFAEETHAVHIVNSDVTSLMLYDATVDAVISDIPFGAKHSTVDEVRHLLPKLIPSLHRVLKVGGRVVLLVGAQFRQLLSDCVRELNNADHSDVKVNQSDSTSHVDNQSLLSSHSNSGVDITSRFSNDDESVDENVCAKSGRYGQESAVAQTSPVWTALTEHYVKLGETHAYICSFTKNR